MQFPVLFFDSSLTGFVMFLVFVVGLVVHLAVVMVLVDILHVVVVFVLVDVALPQVVPYVPVSVMLAVTEVISSVMMYLVSASSPLPSILDQSCLSPEAMSP